MLYKTDKDFIKKEIKEEIEIFAGQIISAIDVGFKSVDSRFDKVENRLDKVENRLGNVEEGLNEVKVELVSVKRRLTDLETDLPSVSKVIDHEKRISSLERATFSS